MSERRGLTPSELLGITCDFCAHCLDEALYVLDAIERKEEEDTAEPEESKFDEARRKHREAFG